MLVSAYQNQIFSVFYHTKMNFRVLNCWSDETRHLKMPPLTLRNYNRHFSLWLQLTIIIFIQSVYKTSENKKTPNDFIMDTIDWELIN